MNRFASMIVPVVVLCGLIVTGCDRDESKSVPSGTTSNQLAAATLPASLFVDDAPSGGRGVAEIKADATATGEVVVEGRIGGRVQPFVEGVAVFLLADTGMKTCSEIHGDSCKTPWDYCCEPRASLAAKTATIQIVDAAGKPLRLDLSGKQGLSPLARLTVAGEIASRDGGTLVINARTIHVAEK